MSDRPLTRRPFVSLSAVAAGAPFLLPESGRADRAHGRLTLGFLGMGTQNRSSPTEPGISRG